MVENSLIIQLVTALIICLIFVLVSLFWIRKEHMAGRVLATRIGSLIYGAIFATFVSVVLVPLRLQLMESDVAGSANSAWLAQYLPAFAVFLIIIRSDVTGRLPGIGTFIRAYRGAMLRRTIESAEKRLEKMDALEARTAGA